MVILERKVLSGFVIASAALITLAGLTWNFSRQMLDATGFVAHTHQVLFGIRDFESQLNRASAAQRGYLISGDKVYRKEFDDAIASINSELEELGALTADNAQQQSKMEALRQDVGQRISLFRHYIDLHDEKGAETARSQYGAGLPVSERISARLREMESEEHALLKQRQEMEQQRTRAAQAGFIALLLFLMLILPFLYLRIRNDIRQRARAQTDMKRLTDVLDSTPDIVTMADASGKPTYFNRSARMQLGIQEEDAARVDLSRLFPPWAYQRFIGEGMPAAIASGTWSGENAFLSREGKEIPVSQVIISHQQLDGSISVSAISRSIADRKEAERLVHEAAKYNQSNANALALYNTETNREQVLKGTLDILADGHPFPVSAFYAFDEWAGAVLLSATRGAPHKTKAIVKLGEGMIGEAAKQLRTIQIDAPDHQPGGLTIDTGFDEANPSSLLFAPVAYRGALHGVLALAATTPLNERDRHFVELIATQLGAALHNIKQFEDMKLLAEQLRTRNDEIANKNEEVEQASRMKSEFLANMSHELRTPLNAIIGFSEVIRDGIAGPVSPEQKEYANDILSSGQHLLSLINDILDLSKIEAGYMTLDLDVVDPAGLADSGVSVLKEKAMSHRIALSRQVEPGLGTLMADARKAKQIIYNLLSNAVKFTPDGGKVELALRRVARRDIEGRRQQPGMRIFPLTDSQHEEFLEISVSDTGIGMSQESLQKLFEPFTQIDSSHARQYEGTGLGLAMVRRLAELHGGGAMVSSEPDKGSRFIAWLPWRRPEDAHEFSAQPAAQAAAVARAAALQSPQPAAPEERATGALIDRLPPAAAMPDAAGEPPLVLVVEDDPKASRIFHMQLESEGYRIAHAQNAETGVTMAAELHPDAIVLDILLPGIDGWQMLTRLKQTPATAAIPVVIVSITDHPAQGFALGASQVLTKPVTQEELMSALGALGLQEPHGESVLVADDDPKAVSLMSVQLKAAGLTPIGAYGGQEAIDLAISKKPALIVLDLMMPQVSGFDVVHTLHALPDTAEIPIVILTAKTLMPEDRERLNGKVQRIIEKSDFDSPLLHSEVKRALAKKMRRMPPSS